jgi:hypothetical protein
MARKIISDKSPRRGKGKILPSLSVEFDDAVTPADPTDAGSTETALMERVTSAGTAVVEASAAVKIPSVLEILETMQDDDPDLTSPALAFALPEQAFLDFAFWSGDADLGKKATQIIRGEHKYEKAVTDGIWRRAWLWIRDYDPQPAKEIPSMKVTANEVHCPHVPDCEVDFSSSGTTKLDVTVTALGTGGGLNTEIEVAGLSHLGADCGAMKTEVDLRITPYRNKFSGKIVHVVKVLRIGSTLFLDNLPPAGTAEHPCSSNYSQQRKQYSELGNRGWARQDRDFFDFPLKAVTVKGKQGHKRRVTKDLHFKSVIPLSPAPAPVPGAAAAAAAEPPIGITVKSHFISEVVFLWTMVPGHDYLGFGTSPRSSIRYWAWD